MPPQPPSHDDRPDPGGDDDARLGAWLDGDLSAAETSELEARLHEEPQLRARAEALRAVRERLAGAEQTAVPPGFTDRVVRAVLDGGDTPVGPPDAGSSAPASTPSTAKPTSLAAARTRRQRRATVLAGGAAAVLVAVAVGSSGLLTGQPEEAADEALETPLQEADDAGSQPTEGHEAAEPGQVEEPDEEAEPFAEGDLPRVVDEGRRFDTVVRAVDDLAGQPEATALLGTGPDRARDLAAASAERARVAEPFAGGPAPAACLAEARQEAGDRAVIARLEWLQVGDARALAAVLVIGTEDGPLDTVVVDLRDPDAGCEALTVERRR